MESEEKDMTEQAKEFEKGQINSEVSQAPDNAKKPTIVFQGLIKDTPATRQPKGSILV